MDEHHLIKINELRKRLEGKIPEIPSEHLSNDGLITSTNGIKAAQKLDIQNLKKDAVYIDPSLKNFANAERMLEYMSEASFHYQRPVSSEWDSKQFYIEANSTEEKACESFIEQVLRPQDKSYEELKSQVDDIAEGYSDTTQRRPYYNALNYKTSEAIVEQYPEKADTLDTIQLHDLYLSSLEIGKKINMEPLLKKSITEYMSGKETFKPTIYNVASLSDVKEFAFKSGMYSLEDLDKRIAQTEQEMLKTLDKPLLFSLSNKDLSYVGKVAAKHPEDDIAKQVIAYTVPLLEKRNKNQQHTY